MNTSQGKSSSSFAPNPVLRKSRLSAVVRALLACLLVMGLAPFSFAATQQAYAATTHTITYDADGGSGVSLPDEAAQRTGDMIAIYDGTGLARTGDTFTSWTATWSDGVEQEVASGEIIALRNADLTLTAQYAGAALSKNSTTEGTLPVINSGWCSSSVGGIGNKSVATITFTDTAPSSYSRTWNAASVGDLNAYAVFKGNGLYDVYLVSSENVQGAVDSKYLFYNCAKMTSINFNNHFDTSNVTNMSNMFYGCSSLTSLDLSSFDTSNVTNMSNMFYECSSLTSLDLSSFDTSSVTNMDNMFRSCSNLTSFDGFDTSNVTAMSYMFYKCSSLTSLDVSVFDTSKTETMEHMFQGCSSLTSLDVSSFDTSRVSSMTYMFHNCSSLSSLDLSSFDTSHVTTMGQMFYNCSSLSSLDLSSFDTSGVTYMWSMFYNCSSLTSLDVSSFDTSNVEPVNYMFYNCSSLISLDLSSFDTSKVTGMNYMFYNCSSLTSLDLSSFDTTKVTNANVNYMLNGTNSSCIVGCRNADEVTKFSTSPYCSIPAANFKVGKPVVTALSLADEGVTSLSEASAIQPGGADVTDSDAPQSPEATDSEGQGDTTDTSLDPSTETSPGTTDEGADVSLETLIAPNQAHADETDASLLALGNGVEKGAVAKGDEIDYSLSVAYSGSTDTKSGVLVVTDVLPNHLSYVEGSASIADTGFETQFASEPTYDETTNTLTFSLTDIPAGSQVDVIFKALVVDDATSLGQTLIEYVNQASVTCNATTTLSNAVRHYSGSRSASTHLVTYSYSGDIPGAASSLPSTLSYSPGAEVALAPDVVVFGYTFSGWQVMGVTLSSSVFTMPDSDVTITGTWTKDPQYTLTYEWAGLRSTDDLPNNLPQMPVVTLTKGLDAPTPAYPVAGATQDSASENDPFASFYKDYEFMGWSSSTASASTTQASLREVIQGDTVTTGSWQRRASDDPVVDPTDSNTSADDISASDTSATTTSKTGDTTGILIGLISLVMAVSATGATLAWKRRGLRE